MPISARVEIRSWWLTVSNAEDRSRRIRTEERDVGRIAHMPHIHESSLRGVPR